jgi:hypothetical protein
MHAASSSWPNGRWTGAGAVLHHLGAAEAHDASGRCYRSSETFRLLIRPRRHLPRSCGSQHYQCRAGRGHRRPGDNFAAGDDREGREVSQFGLCGFKMHALASRILNSKVCTKMDAVVAGRVAGSLIKILPGSSSTLDTLSPREE